MNYALKKMRILLIGDASFVHATLRRGLAGRGHDVVLMSDGNGWHDSPRDIDLRRDMRRGKLGGLGVVLTLLRNLPRLVGNDVVHIHNYQFVPLMPRWNTLLLRFLKRFNRCVVKGCYGDDPQVLEMQLKGVPRYSDMYWGGSVRNAVENRPRLAEQRLPEFVACWRESSLKADALLPCLYEYWLAYDVEPFRAKLRYMPLPVRIPDVARVKGTGAKVKVLVGVQSKREYMKGATKIAGMVSEVARRHPGRLDVRYVEDVPYGEYCALLEACDVLVDQFYSYTPSMNSLAAMARGTVVIGGGEEEYYRFIGEDVLRPIINVSPEKSFDDNVAAIERALTAPGGVESLSRQSIEFVRKYHDYRLVAAECERIYSGLLG